MTDDEQDHRQANSHRQRRTRFSRRDLMKQVSATAATAALMSAAKAAFPGRRLRARPRLGPEVTKAILGYIALMDAFRARHRQGERPLRQARHARRGGRQAGLVGGATREQTSYWARKITASTAARISSRPMALSDLDGQGDPEQCADAPMYILARLNLDAQAISVSNDYKDLKVTTDASPLKAAFERKKAEGKEVKNRHGQFPGGTARLVGFATGWRRAASIRTRTFPPSWSRRRRWVANMKVGNMDAFLASAKPWNEQLVNQGIGFTACTTGEIWSKHPGEGARPARLSGVDKNPKAAKGAADGRHGRPSNGAKKADNKQEMFRRSSAKRQWFNVPVPDHHRPGQGRHQTTATAGSRRAPSST